MKYDKDGLREDPQAMRMEPDARRRHLGAWYYEDNRGFVVVMCNYEPSAIIPRQAILDYADRVRGIADTED